jgi:DsbC/DsbD-like thiol-disulfide interchange protein
MLGVMVWVPPRRDTVLARSAAPAHATVLAAAVALLAPAAPPAFAAASPWSDHEVVAARLVAGGAQDGMALIGLHFRLAPEWHVYWKHPGDAGAAPEVELTLDGKPPPGPLPTTLAFPPPRRFHLPGGLEAIGYEDEVVYPVLTYIPGEARGRLRVAVDYVACAVECIPFHDDLELMLDGAATGGDDEELLRRWWARLPQAPVTLGLDARLTYQLQPEPRIELELAGAALEGAVLELFLVPPPGAEATFGPAVHSTRRGSVLFHAPVLPATSGKPPQRLRVSWTVTGLHVDGAPAAATNWAYVQAGTTVSPWERPARATAIGGREPRLIAALSLPALLLAVLVWTAPSRDTRAHTRAPAVPSVLLALPDPLFRGLGFLAVAALVWSSYRLAPLLPAARVAGIQVSWLAVALAVDSAAKSAGARRVAWWALAAVGAALGVWLA